MNPGKKNIHTFIKYSLNLTIFTVVAIFTQTTKGVLIEIRLHNKTIISYTKYKHCSLSKFIISIQTDF